MFLWLNLKSQCNNASLILSSMVTCPAYLLLQAILNVSRIDAANQKANNLMKR